MNDDLPPALSINDMTVTEGNTSSVNAVFTVSLSPASGQTVTVNYATANGSATASTTADYLAVSGTLPFAPGVTTQSITVVVRGDMLDEDNETFFVNLSSAANATIARSQGRGTINDNDPTPSLVINDVSATEGNSGTQNFTFTVTLSAASGRTVTVNCATASGTAVAGTTGNADYIASSGTLTFSPGTTTRSIPVAVRGDTTAEPNETFFVNLSTIADSQGRGTILNDD